jgi:hypothetical protein
MMARRTILYMMDGTTTTSYESDSDGAWSMEHGDMEHGAWSMEQELAGTLSRLSTTYTKINEVQWYVIELLYILYILFICSIIIYEYII